MNDQAPAGKTVRVRAQDNTLPWVIPVYPPRSIYALTQSSGAHSAVTHYFNGLWSWLVLWFQWQQSRQTVGARTLEEMLKFKDWQIWKSLRGRFNENRWRVPSSRERKQSVVFIFSFQCSNRKRTSGLINHESFHRGLFFGEIDMREGFGLGRGGATMNLAAKKNTYTPLHQPTVC